jgi:hypothetical protein
MYQPRNGSKPSAPLAVLLSWLLPKPLLLLLLLLVA